MNIKQYIFIYGERGENNVHPLIKQIGLFQNFLKVNVDSHWKKPSERFDNNNINEDIRLPVNNV